MGDFLIIRALNESNGFSIISDEEILIDRDFISSKMDF